jgi:alpha-tubulin suppressor-like RCC1 family protein
VLAITDDHALWWLSEKNNNPSTPMAFEVVDAAVGDGANYYITAAGDLFVKGRAHRGQYGDGLLTSTSRFVKTASDAKRITAHTGHAILLLKNGNVLGTGGNIYGPVGIHGLGDKPIRIYPGSPWENGYNERFNGTLRREVLNAEWFTTTKQAQVVINQWLRQYNHTRDSTITSALIRPSTCAFLFQKL